MNKSFGKYLDFIKNLSFFRHNDLTANLIFILGICLFFVIAEDLGKEFSVEKNEIDFIIAVSEKYISISDFTLSITLIFHEISRFKILNENSFQENLLTILTQERAPPCVNYYNYIFISFTES